MTLWDSELAASEILEAYGGDEAKMQQEVEWFEYMDTFRKFGPDAAFFAEVRRKRVALERVNEVPDENGEIPF